MNREYSQEFTSYALSNGNTPAEQIEKDTERYPGGAMCGFILWMSEMLRRFKSERPECVVGDTIRDHTAKNDFLRSAALKSNKTPR